MELANKFFGRSFSADGMGVWNTSVKSIGRLASRAGMAAHSVEGGEMV